MAPTSAKGKGRSSKLSSRSNSKSKPSSSSGVSKSKKPNPKPPPGTKQKVKPLTAKEKYYKKRHSYPEKSLDLPQLNTITPAGVQKVKGKKKGKVFVDDEASMMTLLAMVNAEKEGQIESKMAKARQMEQIRQARQEEMDKRKEKKQSDLEDTKDSLRRSKNNKSPAPVESRSLGPTTPNIPKKRVSFG